MRFRVRQDGKEYTFGWEDIYAWEDGTSDRSQFGVYAYAKENAPVPDALKYTSYTNIKLTHNSGWGFNGIEDLEIEVLNENKQEVVNTVP